MNITLLHQLPPSENNPRNSEGSFIRGKQGEILFAYSRYTGEHWGDDCACDIALISSFDEGRTWSEPRIIARAADFGVKNVMSVSAMELSDGSIAFFFLIKIEKDGISTIELGRTVSKNGVDFVSERCDMKCAPYYYVVNNDRFVRLSSGRIVAPTAYVHRDLVNKRPFNHLPNSFRSASPPTNPATMVTVFPPRPFFSILTRKRCWFLGRVSASSSSPVSNWKSGLVEYTIPRRSFQSLFFIFLSFLNHFHRTRLLTIDNLQDVCACRQVVRIFTF